MTFTSIVAFIESNGINLCYRTHMPFCLQRVAIPPLRRTCLPKRAPDLSTFSLIRTDHVLSHPFILSYILSYSTCSYLPIYFSLWTHLTRNPSRPANTHSEYLSSRNTCKKKVRLKREQCKASKRQSNMFDRGKQNIKKLWRNWKKIIDTSVLKETKKKGKLVFHNI